jgi:hypothetical protein
MLHGLEYLSALTPVLPKPPLKVVLSHTGQKIDELVRPSLVELSASILAFLA